MSTVSSPALGANSEVGNLRSVMVHRPDIPTNASHRPTAVKLLFDDVIWVRRARQEFDAFIDLMRGTGIEVLLVHELLQETLEVKEGRAWLIERRVRPEEVTEVFCKEIRIG